MTSEKCGNCDHYHAGSDPNLCTLLHCDCDEKSFRPLCDKINGVETFQYYQSVIQKLEDMRERIRYMLLNIPDMRNTDDWEFENQYWHYYLNFCTGMTFSVEIFHAIHTEAQPDLISRMRRKICEPERQAIVILQQEIIVDKLTNKDGRYWEIQSEIKRIIREAKFLPTDYELLKAKGIKEFAVKEALLESC